VQTLAVVARERLAAPFDGERIQMTLIALVTCFFIAVFIVPYDEIPQRARVTRLRLRTASSGRDQELRHVVIARERLVPVEKRLDRAVERARCTAERRH